MCTLDGLRTLMARLTTCWFKNKTNQYLHSRIFGQITQFAFCIKFEADFNN